MYFGIFNIVKNTSKNLVVEEHDLYDDAFAKVYDLNVQDQYDINYYLELAAQCDGKILEFACGSGRVMLPFAKNGYEIHGIDISEGLLKRLQKNLNDIAPRFRHKISYEQADILTYSSDEKYDLIIFPATTICLIKGQEKIIKLFNNAYDLLSAGGKFAFDYRVTEEGKKGENYGSLVFQNNELFSSVFQELADYDNNTFYVNFLVYDFEEQFKVMLGSTEKHMVRFEELSEAISKSKFEKIYRRSILNENRDFKIETIELMK